VKSICILLQNHYETDIRVRRKAEALVSAGYDVDLLAIRSPYSKAKNYKLAGVNVYTISLGKKRGSRVRYAFEYLSFFVWAFYKIFVLASKKQYAVIDINNLPDFLVFACIYPKWKGAKLILDMHEITPEFYISKYQIKPDSWLVRILQFVEKISFTFVHHVININEPIEDLLVSRGLPRSKSTIVMNSVDEEFFNSANAASDAVAASDAPPKFVMMYHGTVTDIYGLDIAIEGFGIAHHEMPGAQLWILGKGSEMRSLERLTRKLGLESKVRFVGLVLPQEIPSWLKMCDLGILPTRQDVFLDLSFSSKLSEYIVMEKPVIASRLKTIRYYFSEEALAYFEPHNASDLAKQMVDLYMHPARRLKLAKRAMKEYKPIRWGVMKERYLDLLAECCGDRESGFAQTQSYDKTGASPITPAGVGRGSSTRENRSTSR
jgi:glycosyltransferase involved in cell wall biosynthesis